MVADTDTADNPYSSPRASATPSGRFKIVRGLLFGIAIVLVLLSLPGAWHTLELANQEYLHIWNSRRAIYDIEINGSPVSIAAAIRHGATIVLIQWLLAAALIVIPRFFSTKQLRNDT